jgi:hypothetical protein
MTAHHRHPLDRLRADPPPGLDDYDWRGADFETDGTDILEGLDATALYDGDGAIYGLRIGWLTLSEAQIKLMLDPAHFARIRALDAVELEQRRQDWLASMEDDRDGQ